MKSIKISILFLTFFSFLSSCKKDFLDKKPIGVFSDVDVWKDISLAKTFLSNLYSLTPSGFERGDLSWHHGIETFDDFSDDAVSQYSWTPYQLVLNGTLSAANSPLNASWVKNYPAIRSINTFLANIMNVPGDDSLKNRLRGEALFLRALQYEELVKVYGGIPVITTVQGLKDVLSVPRQSYNECIIFLTQQLDSAASLLPVSYSNNADYGRATKGAAIGIKSRVLLYAGKFQEAATEAKKVIDLGVYSLSPEYQQLFIKGDVNEMIFAKRYNQLQTYNGVDYNDFNDKNQPYFAGGWGSMNPTQNLVDDYEMTDGLPTTESPLYNPNKPFDNRDSRFYASVLYQGAMWKGKAIDFTNNSEYSATGYYLKKFLNEDQVLYNQGATLDWPIIRYGEILLNYAESQNEVNGPDNSIYSAINQVRSRVKQPSLPASLNQFQMRERIRRERRVELAFEEHRYWDVLRWQLGEKVLNAPIFGLRKQPNGVYEKFKVIDRKYTSPKSRYFPIPQSEIEKNGKLTQNSGW